MNRRTATHLKQLKERLLDVTDLNLITYLLDWDQSTYMPPAGGEARGRQLALLQRLAHQKLTDRRIGRLLEELQPYAASLPANHDDAALIRVASRLYQRTVRFPVEFAVEMANLNATSYNAWAVARPANDFATLRPLLEKKLDLCRRAIEFFPESEHPADPLIAMHDYGMTVAIIRPLFAELRAWLTPLVRAITARPLADDSFLHRQYPAEKQLKLTEQIVDNYGYDFQRGRQDLTLHPFMTKFSLGDIRITTRVHEDFGTSALFSSLHEAGHALYEQGIDERFEGTPLADGTSSGIHESQSRLWENLVGRSRSFWRYFYPKFKSTFPNQVQDISIEEMYRAINKVDRSLIRVEADEVTYNLHVIIRFELELEMLEGKLQVADLPEAWRERYQRYLGVQSSDDRDGCLQDVHWFSGTIGGSFQGYTLGNIMASQFYETALTAHPEIPAQIEEGNFATLLDWLRQNIYQHGSKFTTGELLQQVTGGPLQIEPYKRYIEQKYGELYQV